MFSHFCLWYFHFTYSVLLHWGSVSWDTLTGALKELGGRSRSSLTQVNKRGWREANRKHRWSRDQNQMMNKGMILMEQLKNLPPPPSCCRPTLLLLNRAETQWGVHATWPALHSQRRRLTTLIIWWGGTTSVLLWAFSQNLQNNRSEVLNFTMWLQETETQKWNSWNERFSIVCVNL